VETHIATRIPRVRTQRTARGRLITLLGPMTALGGLLWALAQPYRITLLHPSGQGFWWLVIEPPLLVVAVGIVFWLVVARPLVADLEESGGAP
jgi:hypothetical protein